MPARRQLSRGVRIGGICVAVMVLTVPSASATVTNNTSGTTVNLSSDADADNITLACTSGQVKFVQDDLDLLACNLTTSIVIFGDAGADGVDLSALQSADFPALADVSIYPGDVGDIDNVKGSFSNDTIEAGPDDVIQGLGGSDSITGGGLVLAGDGDDTVTSVQGNTDLGPGDDRLVSPSTGPWSGGPGEDTLIWDFSAAAFALNVNFAATDSVFHLDAPEPPTSLDFPSTQFESYEVTLLQAGVQSWNSAGFSGAVDISGLGGVDRIVAGPGEDFLEGGAGNDEVTGGGGFDFVKAGAGDDQVFVRDGVVDHVNCGDGTDTVQADAGDLLSGCESVQLPPAPPPPLPPPPPPPPAPVVPATGAVTGPKSVVQGDPAKFTFKSPTAGATFQCKLDKKAWKACKSPYKVATKNLKASQDGVKHMLKVRAVLAGVIDATPAKKTLMARNRRPDQATKMQNGWPDGSARTKSGSSESAVRLAVSRSERLSPLPLPLQLLETRNREVEVHLHRDVMRGPRRPVQTLDLLKRQLAGTALVNEDEPVRVGRVTISRRSIAGPVLQSQELPIELGKCPDVGSVDRGV